MKWPTIKPETKWRILKGLKILLTFLVVLVVISAIGVMIKGCQDSVDRHAVARRVVCVEVAPGEGWVCPVDMGDGVRCYVFRGVSCVKMAEPLPEQSLDGGS